MSAPQPDISPFAHLTAAGYNPRMLYRCRCLLILLVLLVGKQAAPAASSAERQKFNAAADAFRLNSGDRAEKYFGEFLEKFPNSERLAEAVLSQAQARYRLGRYPEAITLLEAHPEIATNADYFYWLAESHFHNTNYPAAASAFGRLAAGF